MIQIGLHDFYRKRACLETWLPGWPEPELTSFAFALAYLRYRRRRLVAWVRGFFS